MFKIETVTSDDIPTLVKIMNSAYRGEDSKQGWTSEADLFEGLIRTDAATLERLLEEEDGNLLKCEDDSGKIVACVHLKKQDKRLYLGMLSVLPEYQGKGIGNMFLSIAEKYARDKGCDRIYMQVLSVREDVNKWYYRHGYEPTGERKAFDVHRKFGKPKQELEFMYLEKKLK